MAQTGNDLGLFTVLAAMPNKQWTVEDLAVKTSADPVLMREPLCDTTPMPAVTNDIDRETPHLSCCLRDGPAGLRWQIQRVQYHSPSGRADFSAWNQALVGWP